MFLDLVDENGKKTGWVHLNLGRRRADICVFCFKLDRLRLLAGKLCDFPLGNGKTCDAAVCDKHATSGGKNIDYCPDHQTEATRQGRMRFCELMLRSARSKASSRFCFRKWIRSAGACSVIGRGQRNWQGRGPAQSVSARRCLTWYGNSRAGNPARKEVLRDELEGSLSARKFSG